MKSMTLILGRPGVGKTRLAGTFPDAFFLDTEGGARTAYPGVVKRQIVKPDAGVLSTVRTAVDKLGKLRFENGALWGTDGNPIRTVAVDTIDAIQQAVIDFKILRQTRVKMERGDWGVLITMIRPLNMLLQSLPVNVVVVGHTKTRDGEDKRVGVMDLAVQGALKDQMPRWYDCILHICERPDSKRIVFTQPTIKYGARWLAKDRHRVLSSIADREGVIRLPVNENGYPSPAIAQAITGWSDDRSNSDT